MFLDRNGYLEETFFTFSFSPIRDESGGVGGLFHPVSETTGNMLVERRTRALRDLAGRTSEAKSTAEAFELAAQVLASCELDLPFALLYTLDAKDNVAHLAVGNGLTPGSVASPLDIPLLAKESTWPIVEVYESGKPVEVRDLERRFGPFSCGPYPECPKTALVLPITPPGCEHPIAVIIAGVSSRLPLYDLYRNFCEQVAACITAAVANARAHEAEKERVEKLAALDRAKTVFFSNVSHELRTPLTLMLGPLEDTLGRTNAVPNADDRENLALAHRSGLRLLKLVNSLLDFSRIEAGRIQASYQPENLATLTASLASVFRSAIEKGGLQLVVECPSLDEDVYVDRDMWEKVVLNLLSNAFKFTLQGRIVVRQRREGDTVKLSVEDTGCGIEESELGNIFKRFYRVERSEGRTYEGSGIGLSLVEELVHIHGGTVTAQSVLGQGTIFTVSLPFGKNHLPADRISTERSLASTGTSAEAYTEEALRWIQEEPEDVPVAAGNPPERKLPYVLVADDNADMRHYLERLLCAQFEVVSTPDGEVAWAAILNRRPDLLLSDVMMPKLDGFSLLARIRAHAETATLPVVLLSARAGEESKVEGLQAGADDYLIKPFSAKELLARVRANLETANLRQKSVRMEEQLKAELKIASSLRESHEKLRQSEERFRLMVEEVKDYALFMLDPEGHVATWNTGAEQMKGYSADEIIGEHFSRFYTPEDIAEGKPQQALDIAAAQGKYVDEGWRVRRDGKRFLASVTLSAVHDAAGQLRGFAKITRDVTEQKQKEEALRSTQAKLQGIIDSAMDAIISVDEQQRIVVFNQAAEAVFRCTAMDTIGSTLDRFIPNSLREVHRDYIRQFGNAGVTARSMHSPGILTAVRADREEFPIEATISQVQAGGEKLFTVILRDITERKRAEEAQRESEAQFRTLADSIPQLCWMANADGWIFWYNERWYEYTGTSAEQMEGWGWQSVHDPAALPKVMERWTDSIATGEPFEMIFPLRGADGAFRPFLTRVRPVKDADGKIVRWFGTNTDINAQKKIEEALRQSEERWATTLRSIGDAVISTDAVGTVTFMNDVAQKLTGWTLAEATGKDLQTVFNIVQEVTRIRPEDPVSKVIRLGKVVGLANHTALIQRDGTEIPIEDSGAPIRNREGKIDGVVLVFHDVSEQRNVEKALRSSERLATTGRLAATIAHEIHNPLDAVGNLIFLMQQGSNDKTVQEYSAMAARELERVTRMTQQMLTFQRDAAKPVPVRIKEILDSVLSLYERKTESAGIQVKIEVDCEDEIVALPGELRQVFANLVGNAIEATRSLQGKISLRAYSSREWRSSRTGVRVVVADNGYGIPAEIRSKIFDPFFTTKGEGGTGLGLWVTTDIIRKYNGTMRLWSSARPGRSGTCFSVFLPFGASAEEG
jgi:PAS domain S-box-containing protein